MADAADTLALFAEVAVAIAGFSGIVIAFGSRKIASLSALEMRRLSNLFVLSGMVLIVSLLLLATLHIDQLAPSVLYRTASGILFLVTTPWLVMDLVRVRHLELAERADHQPGIVLQF